MRSSSRRMLRALSTMMSPALVSCTRLPMRCKSGVPVSFSRVAICWETAEGVRLCFGCGDDSAAFLDFEEHLHTSDVVDGHIFLPGALGIALAVVATVFHGASLIVDSCIWYRAGFRPALFETPEVGCQHVGLCSEYFRAECDDSWG